MKTHANNFGHENSKPDLWKVAGKSTVYLFGSIHMADETVYPLAERIEKAFEASQNLAVEADIANVSDADRAMMSKLSYIPEPMSIKDYISEKTFIKYVNLFDEIEPILASMGISYQDYIHIMPWNAWMLLAQLILSYENVLSAYTEPGENEHQGTQKSYNQPEDKNTSTHEAKFELGIDLYFIQKAMKQHKNIIEVEGVVSQLKMFASLSRELQEELLDAVVESFYEDDVDDDTTDAMQSDEHTSVFMMAKNMWQNNDDSILEELNDDASQSVTMSEFRDKVIIERNLAMTNKIIDYLNDEKSGDTFVVDGHGHVNGKNGINQL